MLTCKLKTSWKWLLVWGSLSFQTLRRGMNLHLDFGGTSILMSRTRSWCCRASWGTSKGSFLHLWHVCAWSYGKGWSPSAWLCLQTYVMRWLSRFLKHVFPRRRSNARAYSRVLSPSTSGSGLPYPIPPCASLYPVPARPTWPFQSPHQIIFLMLGSWQSQHAADQRTGP